MMVSIYILRKENSILYTTKFNLFTLLWCLSQIKVNRLRGHLKVNFYYYVRNNISKYLSTM